MIQDQAGSSKSSGSHKPLTSTSVDMLSRKWGWYLLPTVASESYPLPTMHDLVIMCSQPGQVVPLNSIIIIVPRTLRANKHCQAFAVTEHLSTGIGIGSFPRFQGFWKSGWMRNLCPRNLLLSEFGSCPTTVGDRSVILRHVHLANFEISSYFTVSIFLIESNLVLSNLVESSLI